MTSLPNTILIGAAKAGTTSLCKDLDFHPDVYLYPSKETRFFSAGYDKGLDYYRSLFHPKGQKVIMEASPDYSTGLRAPRVADRIHADLPNARLIYMVREPLARMESEYVQELANGHTRIDFAEAVSAWKLLNGSLYDETYEIFTKHFREDQIHVVFFEDYVSDKVAVMRDLCEFLGIEEATEASLERKAANSRSEKIVDPRLLKKLRRFRFFEKYKHLVPHRVKLALKRSVSKSVNGRVQWTPALREKIEMRVRPDAAKFLKRFGKPADFWKVAKH